MRDDSKSPDALVPGDLQADPVWEFVTDDELTGDETRVRPVSERLVRSLEGRLIGTRVRLRNGSLRWAMLSSLSPDSPKKSRHFATVGIEKDVRVTGPGGRSWSAAAGDTCAHIGTSIAGRAAAEVS